MATYTTLDYLPDLTSYEKLNSDTLTFTAADSNTVGWDYSAIVAGFDENALLHENYKFYAYEGATYDFSSFSYFDPYILMIYDYQGNAIVANSESDDLPDMWLSDGYYSQDNILGWIAPYSGYYYVGASWNQGSYYTFYGLMVGEDRGTANVNNSPMGVVSIGGASVQGQTLVVTNRLTDSDGMGAVSYQWKANGVTIIGATGINYTLTQAEVGKTITATASYIDGKGKLESKTSPGTAVVANVNDAPTGTVTISGTATQGQTLSASNTFADVDGLGTISYQWKANGATISGATSSSYTLKQSEVGKTITVTASYNDGQGTAESKTSAATKAVLNGLTVGAAGNDTLMGTYGADKMTGQTGNDIYYLNHASDVIVEAASGGADTVYSYLSSYTLGANLENGRIMSIAAATLIGNGLANTLFGNAGNDNLRGGTGKDTLDGGAGTDAADYSDKSVAVVATLNGATAVSVKVSGVVEDSIKNIENLSGGSAPDSLTGDTLANTLIGNAGNDVLKGMGGKDTLDGGAGIDTADYSDKSVAVVATLNGATAVSVKVSGVIEDSIKNIENLSGGSTADNMTGDTLANTLIGNAGNDVLKGMGGNDILRGGLGNDTLTGGTGQDFFRFDTALNRTSNVDRITDFSAADDTIQLENSIFTKFGSTTTGTLNINYFKAITTGGATDSNDYIVYNKTTGALYYDADGGADGNADGIQFATVTLVGTTSLTNADFVLI